MNRHVAWPPLILLMMSLAVGPVLVVPCAAAPGNPFADLEAPASGPVDPFADLAPGSARTASAAGALDGGTGFPSGARRSRHTATWLKQEIMSQVTWADGTGTPYSRLSYGGELLQKFTDEVKTWGSLDLQFRLVHRAAFQPVLNDAEGEGRDDWFLEYHNAYLDLFDVFNPFMSRSARAKNIGRFNARIGRFYLPFGLNLQTDTHGSVLQLSNERNFGFERDWYAGLWGGLSRNLNYDLYFLNGSGYDFRRDGQKGLVGFRLSLANRVLFDTGWEGGFSVMTGERLSPHALMRSPGVAAAARGGKVIDTRRVGLDVRSSRAVRGGRISATTEISTGRDQDERILAQLYQLDYLRRDRKLGAALQYRHFHQEIAGPMGGAAMMTLPGRNDASIVGEVTWYFRNEIGNNHLHWIKLNVERQLEAMSGRKGVLTTLQYYRYW